MGSRLGVLQIVFRYLFLAILVEAGKALFRAGMERRWRRIAAAALFTSVALGGRTTGRWRSRGLVQRLAGAALLLPRPGAAQEGIHLEGLDANGDGFVDRVELMYVARDILDDQGAVEKRGREAVYEGFAALYEASDIDGDGVLSDAEVRRSEAGGPCFRSQGAPPR